MTRNQLISRAPIIPDRVRAIGGDGFAFVPNRFLRDGFFASLAPHELSLYFLLVLAADRRGMSFYHYDTMCSLLQIPLEIYIEARNALVQKDLVAFDGSCFQVLELPARPISIRRVEPIEESGGGGETSIRAAILHCLRRDSENAE